MNDIIIGDEHCRGKFISTYMANRGRKDVRYFITTGDYFDPYKNIGIAAQIGNFRSIISAAREDPRIILLLGNHDIHYLIDTGEESRMSFRYRDLIASEFLENMDLFKICIELDDDTIVSHAGISPAWTAKWGLNTGQTINSSMPMLKNGQAPQFMYYDGDRSGWGDHPLQSPSWIRPLSLVLLHEAWKWKTQIIGHTRTDVDDYYKNEFFSRELITNYNSIHLDGGIVTAEITGGRKLIMVDTGDSAGFLEREVIAPSGL